jgi:hypothetical protein
MTLTSADIHKFCMLFPSIVRVTRNTVTIPPNTGLNPGYTGTWRLDRLRGWWERIPDDRLDKP